MSVDSRTNVAGTGTVAPAFGDYLTLLALGAVWGGNFLLVKIGVATIPAATFATLRLAIAAIPLGILACWRGKAFVFPRRAWGAILIASIFGNALPFIAMSWGQRQVDAGVAAICMGVMPLATIGLAHLVTHDEKLSSRKLAGVLLGFGGLVTLIGPKSVLGLGEQTMAELAICAAAFCYAINALATKALRGLPVSALSSVMFVISAVADFPFALALDHPWSMHPSAQSVVALIALAALPTAFGTLVMVGLITRLGVSFFSQINFIVPVFGVIWGSLFLGESLSVNALAALVLILAGVAVARRR